jgi:hypothetical protein
MFQFPGCPPRFPAVTGSNPGRVAPFGDPRIADCQRLPGAFRRVAASFLGRQHLGIHRAPSSAAPLPHLPRPPLPPRPPAKGDIAAHRAGTGTGWDHCGRAPAAPSSIDGRGRRLSDVVSCVGCGIAHPRPTRREWPQNRGRSRAVTCQGTHSRRGRGPVEPRGFEPRTSAVQGRRSPG